MSDQHHVHEHDASPPIDNPQFWMEVHQYLVGPVVTSIYAASPAVNWPRFPRSAVSQMAQGPCLTAWMLWMVKRHPEQEDKS